MGLGITGNFGLIQAAAGAAKGVGEGVATVGMFGMKRQLMEEINKLQAQRETMIENLRASHASTLEAQRQKGELGMQKYAAGQAEHRLGIEIGARSRAAGRQMEFQKGLKGEELASQERRTERTAESRENAAFLRSEHSGAGKGKSQYQVINLKGAESGLPGQPGYKAATDRKLMATPHGVFELMGDKYVPYDGTRDGPPDPKSLARANTADIQDVISHPERAQAFLSTYKFLPAATMSSLQQREAQQQGGTNQSSTTSIKLPGGHTFIPPKGYSVSNADDFKSQDDDAAAQAETEAEQTKQEGESDVSTADQASGAVGNAYENAAPNE